MGLREWAKPWQSPEKNYYYLLPRLTYEFLEIATSRHTHEPLRSSL